MTNPIKPHDSPIRAETWVDPTPPFIRPSNPQLSEPASLRESTLRQAIAHTCGDRDVDYGSPVKNLGDTAQLWSTYIFAKYSGKTIDPLQFNLTAEDVAWLNVLQKISRSFAKYKPDNYEDAAAYAAIAGECRADEEEEEAYQLGLEASANFREGA